MRSSALRVGLLVTPGTGLAIPDCTISSQDIAGAALVALAVSYAIALLVLAVLVRLWRRTMEAVDVAWTWQVSCGVVLVLLALVLGFDADIDLFVIALLLEAPFVVAILCGGVRLALALGSKGLMRCVPILAAASLAIPNVLVFVVDPAAGSRIVDLEITFFDNPSTWFWWVAVIALVLEAVLVGRKWPWDES